MKTEWADMVVLRRVDEGWVRSRVTIWGELSDRAVICVQLAGGLSKSGQLFLARLDFTLIPCLGQDFTRNPNLLSLLSLCCSA